MIVNKLNINSRDIILEKQENGCMYCTSHCKDSNGYVRVMYNGKHQRLHRVLYELKFGEIPKGMVIRHKCDDPKCCNIEHLEIGTHQENMNDMKTRNRSCKGKKNIKIQGILNHASKLNEQQVREIYLSNLGSQKLAKMYNVSKTNILYIKRKKQWEWLTNKIDEEMRKI